MSTRDLRFVCPALAAQVLVAVCIFLIPFGQSVEAVEHKLLADIWADGDEFGYAAAMDGDYSIVGAPYDDDKGDDSGSAYIFFLSFQFILSDRVI
jgi:hypothetical protein